jgi:DNA polymerase/3'-5' exonuclease PolX
VLETIITQKSRTMTELKEVHGIGQTTAERLYAEAGIRSVLELERKVESEDATVRSILTAAAWVGVKNHHDISQRIPSYVVQIIGNAVIKVAKDLFPAVEGHICGSYRRGAPDSGDIDVLIAYDDAGPAVHLAGLVEELKKRGIIVCDLTHMNANAVPTKDDGTAKDDADKKWMGLAVDPDPDGPTTKRRLDLLICPRSELPFQLIYLTGSEFLQRHLQSVAKRRGWKMSLHGFVNKKMDRAGSKLVRVVGGTMLEPCKTEREVFERLGVEYLEPHERNKGNRKFTAWATASLGPDAEAEEAPGSESEG